MPQVKRFEFTDILGWSTTRYTTFSICKRKYFYEYYLKYDREFPRRKIEAFKNLVSVPLEIGVVVHKVIEVLLNRIQSTTKEIDRKRFFDFASRQLSHSVDNRPYEEVVYGVVEKPNFEEMENKLFACLENLLASERYEWLVNEAWHSKDEWIVDPPGYGETRLNGMKTYCKVDYLFPVGDTYQIIDWKTGKEDADRHRKQLMGYSAWAIHHLEVPQEKIKSAIAYLFPDYKETEESFNEFDMENLSIEVRAETDAMYEYCRDVDRNLPLDKQEFQTATNDRICDICKFRGICYPEKYPIVVEPKPLN